MSNETSLTPELSTQLLDDPELVGNVARQMILRTDSIDLVAEKIINHSIVVKATYEQRMNKYYSFECDHKVRKRI
jgi:hypothetical protein